MGAGFIVTIANTTILVIGCSSIHPQSDIDAQVKAFLLAMKYLIDARIFVQHLFNSSSVLHEAIISDRIVCDWRTIPWVNIVKSWLPTIGSPSMHFIPRWWNSLSNHLACQGTGLHELTLFHRGRDLPRWLMKSVVSNGFTM